MGSRPTPGSCRPAEVLARKWEREFESGSLQQRVSCEPCTTVLPTDAGCPGRHQNALAVHVSGLRGEMETCGPSATAVLPGPAAAASQNSAGSSWHLRFGGGQRPLYGFIAIHYPGGQEKQCTPQSPPTPDCRAQYAFSSRSPRDTVACHDPGYPLMLLRNAASVTGRRRSDAPYRRCGWRDSGNRDCDAPEPSPHAEQDRRNPAYRSQSCACLET